ncbi:twin-arginine translocase subunit TatC [Halobaculum gomorrense]|uniref:Sec-independent protein translocase protein TatC n=1 Tax=Halobaculum gomorrense TaxID=43928 RepID=A0A1M5T1P3_9EURY|nr:twin-arginine translocase subunit TatC [Halobaculum gomorrense]SHH44699.1 sec-independent protein translocase protein TatC [Halobaculum gomorrense]
MTADSDPPEEPSADADGDRDTETAESVDDATGAADNGADDSADDAEGWNLDPDDGTDDGIGAADEGDASGGDGPGAGSGDESEPVDRLDVVDETAEAPPDIEYTDDDTGDDAGEESPDIDRRSPYADDGRDAVGGDSAGDESDQRRGDDDAEGGYEPPEPGGIDGEEVAASDDRQAATATPGVAGEAATNGAGSASEGGGAMTAAQKGMAAVNEGVGALGGEGGGPDSDQEMPLAEHIEEMMRRLGVVFGIAGVVVVVVLLVGTVSPVVPSAEEIIEFLWDAHAGFEQNRPRVYGPLEFLLTKLKVASLAGLLVGLPVFVYETYRFMRPGLYPHERRYYLAAVPTSLILGIVGVAFAHFIVLPVIFDYFISYTEGSAVLAFSLQETFNLILLLMGYMAIVFQIPLFIQLAIMMGLVTREWMEDRRLLFWSGFVGLAFIVSPDPTGMAPIIVGATMIGLFEGTLALLRWTGN